jgi:hypothetical protein
VTEQAESGKQRQQDRQDVEAVGAFREQVNVLQESKRQIKKVLRVLDEAKLPLDLLEQNTVDVPISDLFEPEKTGGNSGQGDTIRLAAYLYLIALTSRDTIKNVNFNEFLRKAGYSQASTELLLTAFENLEDVWSTYKKVIDCLDIATWDKDPSPDRIWAALEVPRRRYIRTLSAYYVQLSVVLDRLKADPDATASG